MLSHREPLSLFLILVDRSLTKVKERTCVAGVLGIVGGGGSEKEGKKKKSGEGPGLIDVPCGPG